MAQGEGFALPNDDGLVVTVRAGKDRDVSSSYNFTFILRTEGL